MLAQTRLKLRNAESSIAFIQEQHAKTLEGLHKEIKQLQKKNARLTFDLAMIATPGSADSSRCAGCQQLEEELVSSKSEVLRLSSALTAEKDSNALLQHQLKELETKYTEDLSSSNDALQSLNADLERKSNAVALITQQYHQLRARFHQELDSNCTTCAHCHHHDCDVDESNPNQVAPDTQRAQYQFRGLRLTPNPPSGISKRTPTTIQRRNFHRTTSSPVPFEVSSMSSIDSNHTLPTPPMSPKPLSYSSSPPTLRRASKPSRRQTPSLESATAFNKVSTGKLSKRTSRRPISTESEFSNGSRTTTPLEPVRKQKSGVIPSEISDILQSRRNRSQEHVHSKQPHPILPPIVAGSTDSSNDQSQVERVPLQPNQAYILSSSSFQSTPSPAYPRRQHRHFILSKAQGLSSAPVRPMRVLCYSQTGLDSMEAAHVKEEASSEGAEGMLLVKETEDNTWQELHQQETDQ